MGSSGISMPCFIIIRYFEPVCFMHPDLVKKQSGEFTVLFPRLFVCRCHKTSIKLFLLNHTIHLLCYFEYYVKAVPPVAAKLSVNQWNKFVLDR